VILAGRHINDGMGKYIAEQTVKQLIIADRKVKSARVAVLGITFKENCEDLRNSRVIDVIRELESYGIEVLVFDPVANKKEAKSVYGVELVGFEDLAGLDAIVAAVAHDALTALDAGTLSTTGSSGMPLIDIKSSYDRDALTAVGFNVWRL